MIPFPYKDFLENMKTKRKQLYLLFEPISKRLLRIFLQEQLFKVQKLKENPQKNSFTDCFWFIKGK